MQREARVQKVTAKGAALAALAELKKGGVKRSDQFKVRCARTGPLVLGGARKPRWMPTPLSRRAAARSSAAGGGGRRVR